MEKFDIQVLLKDGSFADYIVQNERGSDSFEVYKQEEKLGTFCASADGNWEVTEENGIDEDMQQRIINQLNGFKS